MPGNAKPTSAHMRSQLEALPSSSDSQQQLRCSSLGKRENRVDAKMPTEPRKDVTDHSHNAGDKFYVEETAWRETYVDQTRPLLPAPPVPPFPQKTGHCDYSFDEQSRVLLAKFKVNEKNRRTFLHEVDEKFIFEVMERDDITLVTENATYGLDTSRWNNFSNSLSSHFASPLWSEPHYKVRQFRCIKKRDELIPTSFKEMDGNIGLSLSEYVRYLRQRKIQLERIRREQKRDSKAEKFYFSDAYFKYSQDNCRMVNYGKPFEYLAISSRKDKSVDGLNCIDNVLYFIDYDIVSHAPGLYENFSECFAIPGILPGGKNCLMYDLPFEARPLMGPNLYITPPASFTKMHQDGAGTVDSGHVCLSGYNEVLMLRRLPEAHKKYAMSTYTAYNEVGSRNSKRSSQKRKKNNTYNPLDDFPHNDGFDSMPSWPTKDIVKHWRSMNYYPSVFILKPGQHVHINKGRLHCFRKMSTYPLPKRDCHALLRQNVIEEENLRDKSETICVSLAWDWMFRGRTDHGINREVASILECVIWNKLESRNSLGIPETTLLHTALRSFSRNLRKPENSSLLRGILPSLKFLISRHSKALKNYRSCTTTPFLWRGLESQDLSPHIEFTCALCSGELSNVFFQCMGCKINLKADFYICLDCKDMKKYTKNVCLSVKQNASYGTHHLGSIRKSKKAKGFKKCECGVAVCKQCQFCSACSCTCHRTLLPRYRIMDIESEEKIIRRLIEEVSNPIMKYSYETVNRLESISKKLKM